MRNYNMRLPSIKLQHSPLAGGPTEIHYRQFGSGSPLVFLHGGWGYEMYPLSERQVSLPGVQLIVPDRSGYGRSGKQAIFSADFHRLAVAETLAFLDALNLPQAMFWGHSDGAVIAAWLGITHPERCDGLILEALHYLRVKPNSIDFFAGLAENPDTLSERAISVLARDHGEEHWRNAIRGDCQAWVEIARETDSGRPDLYSGRLNEIRVPVALVHGEADPRTEPGELDRIREELPAAQVHIIPGAGHSPHSGRESHEECARAIERIVAGWM
ncbi:MAG TPA: alpha/beta hydrolase [Candidatus Angelobacter sp.]|nr:alpha/beta hydrolase [Candidatus Angelobacter sp.]